MRLVFDLEANGLYPDTIWCIVFKNIDSGNYFEWHYSNNKSRSKNFTDLLYFIEYYMTIGINLTELIGHGIINYDLPVLKRLTGWEPSPSCKITDTLVLSRLGKPDREGGHSLRAWGDRLGFPKGDCESFDQYSDAMLEYCKRDTDVTLKLLPIVETECEDFGESVELEHDIARIITEQEINGFYFNDTYARDVLDKINRTISSIDADLGLPSHWRIKERGTVEEPYKLDGEIKKLVANWYHPLSGDSLRDVIVGPFTKISIEPFNPDSTQHLKKWLLDKGWKPDEYTPGGLPKLTEKSLDKMGPTGQAINYRGILSHRKRQIEGLLDRVREDGRIGASANPCGTPTGRMRHSNVVNIPKADPSVIFGQEIRSLFCVPTGSVLVGYDAKGLELRVLAHYIGDPKYVEAILTGDIHTYNQNAAGLPDRDSAKTFIYAFVYGAGFPKLGSIVGGGFPEGKKLSEKFYKNIPGLRKLVDHVAIAAKRGYLIGLDGRKLWLREEHKALNTLIQAGGSICMKKSAQFLDQMVDKSKAMKVVDMHDEAQWEVHPDYVETFTELVHEAFVLVTEHFKLKCPLEADVKVGMNWAETH